MDSHRLLYEVIRSEKSLGPQLRLWMWPAIACIGAAVLAVLLPLGELFRLVAVIAVFALPIFAVAAVGSFLNNRARARAFERALDSPECIERIVRLSIRTRSGTFPHVALLVRGDKDFRSIPVVGLTDEQVEGIISAIAARAPHAAIGRAPGPDLERVAGPA